MLETKKKISHLNTEKKQIKKGFLLSRVIISIKTDF